MGVRVPPGVLSFLYVQHMPWIYEPSPDKKHKRGWDQAQPGFVVEKGEEVGKCPANMGVETAETLLNDENRIEYSPLR